MEHGGQGRASVERHDRLRGEERALNPILEDAGGTAVILARAVALAAIVVALGALAFRFLVVPRLPVGMRGATPLFQSHAARLGAWACTGLVAVALPRLWLQARGLAESGEPVWPMAASVLSTTWGRSWMLQGAGALIAALGFLLALRARRIGWNVALAAGVMMALSAACMGHAIAGPRLVWVSVPSDALHVASVGAWVGTLFVLARIGFSVDIRSEGGGAIAALVRAFHRVALWSAAAAIATGTLNALLRLQHLTDLFTSGYGTILLVKIGAVGAVAYMGAWNARSAGRRAQAGRVPSVMRTIGAEVLFAATTLAVTAVLVGTAPQAR
ncbi:MAG TPA: CopD family protein [Gemmatimonadaceae bacterium]|nr:CopD family protein [Gemmatimonadaceae bacterium]